MPGESSVLVVANVTATSRELAEALKERAAAGPCSFSLLVPAKDAGDGAETARARLEEGTARMRNEGLELDDGRIGDSDPVAAVMDGWEPGKFDEIVASTLPPGTSKWLEAEVPQRLEEQASVPVRHVVARGSAWETFERPSGAA